MYHTTDSLYDVCLGRAKNSEENSYNFLVMLQTGFRILDRKFVLFHKNNDVYFINKWIYHHCTVRPFQVFSMFSVHPKIKNLSFYQVKTHKWLEKTQQFILSLMKYFPSNKTFYHDHFNSSCTTFICHCSLSLSSLFCIHVTESLMNILYFVFS
jgi:hypothetical protein